MLCASSSIFGVNDFNDKFVCVTDASLDGGIDFIYFDEENSKLFICQAKYTENLTQHGTLAICLPASQNPILPELLSFAVVLHRLQLPGSDRYLY